MLGVNIIFYGVNYSSSLINNLGLFKSEYGRNLLSVIGLNFFPIGILLFIHAYRSFYDMFAMASSFNIIKTDFFGSLIFDNLIMVLILSSIQGVLLKLDPLIIRAIGLNPLYDFGFINLEKDGIFYIIISIFFILIYLMSIFNLLASLNYKYTKKIWLLLVPLALVGLGLDGFFKSKEIGLGLLSRMSKGMGLNNPLSLSSGLKYLFFSSFIYFLTYLVVRSTRVRED